MVDFNKVDTVLFPQNILCDAFDFLKKVGSEGYEGVVLFLGNKRENVFSISQLYIPKQQSFKGPDGLMYHVSGEELGRLDDWSYENNLSLFAQMHTHPGEAYHSASDDINCIVTKFGGISIVVPNFAKNKISIEIWVVYRLIKNLGWSRLTSSQKYDLIKIIK